MSFVPAVRDYIGLINNLYDSTSTDPSIGIIIRNTVIYLFETIRYFVFYLLTFQWFRDLCYLPIITPQISLSLIKEKIFLQDPLTPFLTFLETPALSNNRFLIGFSNSFFTSLPISCSSLICIYRLLINGIPAAFFSLLGNILGQSCFLICVLFGLRSFIIPWFSLEPLNYIIGLYIVLNIICQSLQKRSWKQIQFSEQNRLVSVFLTHFLLIWTEQPSIYQHIGNLTISSDSTILETLTSNQNLNFFISHSFYLFGFIVGSFLFSLLFGVGILKIRSFVLNRLNIRYSVLLNRFHTIAILWITTLTFASMPYYGFDYLLTNCFGFVSYDTALEKTLFHASSFRENLLHKYAGNNEGSFEKQAGSLFDLASFDKSYYLVSRVPVLPDDPAVSIDNFEELNYQGEYAWTSRDRRRKRDLRKPFLSQSSATDTGDGDIKKLSSSGIKKGVENRFSFFSSENSLRKTSIDHQNEKTPLNSQETELKILQLLSPFSLQNDWLTNVYNRQNEEREKINQNQEKNGLVNDEKKLKGDSLRRKGLFNYRNEEGFLSQFLYETSGYSFLSSPSLILGDSMAKYEEKSKNSFYTNPLYRFLLEKDVDAFLSRQPKDHFLSVFEEKQLGRNRVVLNDYYNTLRSYKELPSWDAFQDEFNGSLSYANKIYNQQFKGTLSLVRRLFSITVNPLDVASQEPLSGVGAAHKSNNLLDINEVSMRSIEDEVSMRSIEDEGSMRSIEDEGSMRSIEDEGSMRSIEDEGSMRSIEDESSMRSIEDSSNKTTTPPAIAAEMPAAIVADSHGGFATIAQRAHDRILKLDQPLYKTNVGNMSYLSNLKDNKKNQSKVKEDVDQIPPGRNLQSKRKGSKLKDLPNLLMHEEAQNIVPATSTQSLANASQEPLSGVGAKHESKIGNRNQKSKASKVLDFPKTNPLIESTNPTPFYIGWDEKSRKMVITNRLLFSLNQNVPILAEPFNKDFFVSDGKQPNPKRKDGRFTAWPIPKSMLRNTRKEGLKSSLPSLPYRVLFDLVDTPAKQQFFQYAVMIEANNLDIISENKNKFKEIPANFRFNPNESSFRKVLSPNRGGFVWPETKSLKSH